MTKAQRRSVSQSRPHRQGLSLARLPPCILGAHPPSSQWGLGVQPSSVFTSSPLGGMAALDPRVNQPPAPSCHLPQTEKCCWLLARASLETAVPPKWPPSLGDAVGSPLSQDEPNPWKGASGSCPVNVTQPQGPRATDTLTGGCAGPHAPTFGQRLQRGGASPLGAAQHPEVGPWSSGKLPSGHSRRGVMGTGGQCGRPWLWPSLLWGCGGHFAPPGLSLLLRPAPVGHVAPRPKA